MSDGVIGSDRVLPDGRPTDTIRDDQAGDHPGDRTSELAVEVAMLRERIADKDSVIADLRHRLDVADRRLDEAAEERRLVNSLREGLADAVAAERIAAGEAAGLRAEVERLAAESRRPWWRRWLR